MSDNSVFNGTIQITGTNSGGFQWLSDKSDPAYTVAATLGCNSSTGCPASGGPFHDFGIQATQGSSQLTIYPTITGTTSLAPVVSQIHNSGVGFTPSTRTYNNGSALAAYQLTAPTSGSCTSASSGFGPARSDTPSTVSSISDGT
jgi:hypothetical protein